jgi:hypothetical protein
MLQSFEHRSEPRTICEGDVRLYADGLSGELMARLLDVSNNGFRAMHSSPDVTPGREFDFRHRFFVGRARVVWTRPYAGSTQSGFQVLRG